MSECVSVLICTYNYARYLPECLASVLNQSVKPHEIIVIDDGSIDGTPELMKQYPEVRYVYQQNVGKAVAFSRGFALAAGDIICHLDADDFWDPHKLERVLACFHSDSSLGGVIHEVKYVSGSSFAMDSQFHADFHAPWSSQRPAQSLLLHLAESEDVGFLYPLPGARGRFYGVPNTSSIRKRVLEDLMPLPADVEGSVDGIIVAAALRYGMIYLPEELATCRIHESNASLQPDSMRSTIAMWEFLMANPNFRSHLSHRHANLLRAKVLERKAYLASRTGANSIRGACAALHGALIVAANGYRFNWKHLALPFACVLPLRRARGAGHRTEFRSPKREQRPSSPVIAPR